MKEENKARCSRCGEDQVISVFAKDNSRKSGHARWCKPCVTAYNRERLGFKPKRVIPVGKSWCNHCQSMLDLGDFGKSCRSSTGASTYCKKCMSKWMYHENPERRERNLKRSAEWDKIHRRHPRVLQYLDIKIQPTTCDLAYIAGVMDAEGSFVLTPASNQFSAKVSLYNNDLRPLIFAQDRMGGKLSGTTRRRTGQEDHVESSLSFFSQTANRAFCQKILPYIVLKKRQCQIILESLDVEPAQRAGMKSELSQLNLKAQVHAEVGRTEAVQHNPITASAEDWSYFAGWLDGDGTLSIQRQEHKNETFYPWVIVYSTKPEGIEYLYKIFGGQIAFRQRNDRHALEGSLRFTDQNYVGRILSGVLPYLICKREQAEIQLKSLEVHARDRGDFKTQLEALNAKNKRVIVRNK